MSILRQDKCLDSGATITDESVLLSIFFIMILKEFQNQ